MKNSPHYVQMFLNKFSKDDDKNFSVSSMCWPFAEPPK